VDDLAFVPVAFGNKLYPLDRSRANPFIMVKTAESRSMNQLEGNLLGMMRSIRSLGPREEANFALNHITLLTQQIDQVMNMANIAGWFIAAFSILVGGFGVANIMFVSVKELTSIIGIQKAIGAPKAFILIQFLVESIVPCIIGGLMGIMSVGLITLLLNLLSSFQVVITRGNIFTGVGFIHLYRPLCRFDSRLPSLKNGPCSGQPARAVGGNRISWHYCYNETQTRCSL